MLLIQTVVVGKFRLTELRQISWMEGPITTIKVGHISWNVCG